MMLLSGGIHSLSIIDAMIVERENVNVMAFKSVYCGSAVFL
jgi:hypothetical protein